MSRFIISRLLPVTILLCGCTSGTSANSSEEIRNDDKEVINPVETPQEPDSIPFKTKEFEKKKGENVLEIEYPVTGNPELLKSIRTWMNEMLSDTYKGNLDDADAFFRHYSSLLGTDPEMEEYGGFTINKLDVEYLSDLVVTYEHDSYEYEGGAHGMGGSYGTTFLCSDGTIFDKDCFTSYKPMQQLFIDGLKRYFKVKTDKELLDCLISIDNVNKIAPPGRRPWVDEDGVVFSYSPYEIAPYSAGAPNFTIPYSKIAPYLTDKGKRFFNAQ